MTRPGEIPIVTDDPSQTGLNYLAVEISYGGDWINLNDGDRYKISGQGTRDNTNKTWRKVTAESPVLGGNYLVHAVPEMLNEQIVIWVYGNSQTDLSDNLFFLYDLFEQFNYRMRWQTNEYRETWICQLAEVSSARGQIWTHNQMAMATFTVPRYPLVSRETIV